ncbi:hypothetical protein ASH00_02585 [Arthrobacter sp. Soil782]|uniref:restriction endonuclease subunit S n=1 Tax=Arthrobacter sp. Soil782 TaxID=1736410 RepID=UPI0006FCD9C6|nr:restriction endonuclease subunit S [Arthrobacter sp. Soil782]KRF08609.1 hypothetical protein ASH00_02585 [Arthrobacter sp. Soil782]
MRTIRTIEEVCTQIVDCEHKTAPLDPEGEYFAVGTPAMRGNAINYEESRRISKDTFIRWTRRMAPQQGDLLFAREAPVGPIVMIPDTGNIAPGQRTMLLRPDPEQIDSRFLYYLLTSPRQQELLLSQASGSTVAHLNVADVRAFELPPLPSVDEQRAIAEVLGALDDKIAANTKLASTSADLAGLIYDTAVSSRETQPMSHVLTPILGGTPPRANPAYWEEEYLWASARDVTSAPFGMIVDTAEKISNAAATTTKAKPLPLGSVILTARGTVGAVARLAVPSSFNQSCYGFVPDALPPGILYFSILRATQRAKAIAHGSVFDTITMKTFDHLDIPVLCETSVETLESRIGPLLDVISEAVKENATLANTRDALLPQLMSGRLRVKDVADVVGSLV